MQEYLELVHIQVLRGEVSLLQTHVSHPERYLVVPKREGEGIPVVLWGAAAPKKLGVVVAGRVAPPNNPVVVVAGCCELVADDGGAVPNKLGVVVAGRGGGPNVGRGCCGPAGGGEGADPNKPPPEGFGGGSVLTGHDLIIKKARSSILSSLSSAPGMSDILTWKCTKNASTMAFRSPWLVSGVVEYAIWTAETKSVELA